MGGWIEPHGGRYRVRVRRGVRKHTVETCDTEEQATKALERLSHIEAARLETPPNTLLKLGPLWFDLRERRGLRGVTPSRCRWRTHVDHDPIATVEIERLSRRDILAWVERMERRGVGWGTRKAIVDLVRGLFEWQRLDKEAIATNPAADVKVTRPADAHESDGWTYLLPAEQAKLTECPPKLRPTMLLAAIALGTGLRQGEQWNLELRDLHLEDAEPWLLVRWGSQGKPPKSGKMRRVPLFGLALAAIREWIAMLPTYAPKNPHELVFPTERGCRRQLSKKPRDWVDLTKLLGPAAKRHDGHSVRWHDLRHTCASSLVAGWWGRPWRLEEVRELMGHSSVTTTERYAHMAPGVLSTAASATPGAIRGGRALPPREEDRMHEMPETEGRAMHDSNVRPLPSEGKDYPSLLAEVRAKGGTLGGMEERMVRAVRSRHRNARTIALDLARAAGDYRAAVERLLSAEAGPRLRAVKGGRS